jgi:K+-transporting ATPase KdpF subunit
MKVYCYGCRLRGWNYRFLLSRLSARKWLQKTRRAEAMTWLYVLSGAIAVGLLVYLVYALVKAEEF